MKRPAKVKVMRLLAASVRTEYPEEADRIIRRAFAGYRKLCCENAFEPLAVRAHTHERIYPCIAFYKAASAVLCDKNAAYCLIADMFGDNAQSNAKALRLLLKLPFLFGCVPAVMDKLITVVFGTHSGFRMKRYPQRKGECHIDMISCPYHNACRRYGCEELTTAFCNSDDIAYGNMHRHLSWERTKTLGRGNDCCDFILRIR